MEQQEKRTIRSFRDLDVYRTSYDACLKVMKEVLPQLPTREKSDLVDQLSRSCKAVPRLIAEGYAKKHQVRGFQKYLDDAMSESNETIVGIEQSRDIYNIDSVLCNELATTYDRISRQLYKLALAWDKFSNQRKILTD